MQCPPSPPSPSSGCHCLLSAAFLPVSSAPASAICPSACPPLPACLSACWHHLSSRSPLSARPSRRLSRQGWPGLARLGVPIAAAGLLHGAGRPECVAVPPLAAAQRAAHAPPTPALLHGDRIALNAACLHIRLLPVRTSARGGEGGASISSGSRAAVWFGRCAALL